jgi:hypothetical protein
MFKTPILFLVFNRPETTFIVFNAIRKIRPSKLYIAGDGPRDFVPDDMEKCKEVRDIVSKVDWPCEINTLFREENLGCKLAVSGAITWFFDQVDSGIILEDDCLPDLSFFEYCSELLAKYENHNEIMLIGGNNFHKMPLDVPESYYFSKYAHIWGWASWRRAWDNYNVDISDYGITFNEINFASIFQSKSEKKYWLDIFHKVTSGYVDTWDYQLIYAIWKVKGMCITPRVNLVRNIGLNGNTTHLFLKDSFKNNLKLSRMKFPLNHPKMEINEIADIETYNNLFRRSFRRVFRLIHENSFGSLFYYLKRATLPSNK